MRPLTACVSVAFVAALDVVVVRPATSACARPAVYTAAQATAGQAAYQANCASCHQPTLVGQNEAPPLAGTNFMTTWRQRTTKDLIEYMAASMPPGKPSLAEADYVNITAFILQFNGAPAGTQALTAATATPIGTIATGQRPAHDDGDRATRWAAGDGDGAPARPAGAAPSRGHSLVGDIKNYVPVTDAMLKNPPPGDWLMARRNYQAWSYSPLDEITRGNVKELKLAWSWSMNDAGSNQSMPLVHNGIMYLGNTGNMMQAFDAATGDLLWENQVGPNTIRGFGAVRNIAIYRDKVFMATNDGRLVAFDARTGKVAWDTPVADPRGRLHQFERPDRRARQGDPGPARLRSLPARTSAATSAPTTPRPASSCGSSTPSRGPARPAAIPGARCPTWRARAATPGSPAATIPISI